MCDFIESPELIDELGTIKEVEPICPGVYYLAAKREDDLIPGEYYVVTKKSVISRAARSYGRVLSDLRVFSLRDAASGYHIVEYEIEKYRVKNHLTQDNSLRDISVFSAEYHPEYFGVYPVPLFTPRGRTVRHRVWTNGIYWLETDLCKELLAVCYPIWSTELTDIAEQLGEQTEYDRANDIHNTLGYIFFPRQTSCIPIYELMQTRPKWAGTLIDKPALMNAIWTVLPEYALLRNQQEQLGMNDIVSALLRELGAEVAPNISLNHMIPIFPEVGEDFLLFDRDCKNMLEVCPYCGEAVVSARSNFCAFCGAQLRELPPEIAAIVPPEEQRQKPMPVAIGCVPDSVLNFLKGEYKVQDKYDTPDQSRKETEDIARLIELVESDQFVWFSSKEQIQFLATFIGYRAQCALWTVPPSPYSLCRKTAHSLASCPCLK